MTSLRPFLRFTTDSLRLVLTGNAAYWAWLAFLAALIASGVLAYVSQMQTGLIVTAMRDQVSWGFYIGNFTFLVGVAAAAVVLVIPAYVYQWKPIKEVVILGEILAVSAIIMAMLFVVVDLGRPERAWHLIPLIGHMNLPSSLLAWDVLVLNLYFVLNFVVVSHLLYRGFQGRPYNAKRLVVPLMLLLDPRRGGHPHGDRVFVCGSGGAAVLERLDPRAALPLLGVLLGAGHHAGGASRSFSASPRFAIKDSAIWQIAELMAYAMFLNLFMLGAEVFKEVYSNTEHLLYTRYWYSGLGEHVTMVPYAWAALVLNVLAFVLFIVPATRRNALTLNLGCLAHLRRAVH